MLRVVVIGTSAITECFLVALQKVAGAELFGVYSRTLAKAEAFGKKFGARRFYDTLEEIAADSKVDAVYIASPNACHCEQAISMLAAGKHVLCEKPIASNSKEFYRMAETARENHVVLLEAMRSIFAPGFLKIKALLPALGTIRQITFLYCQYSSRYDNFKKGIVENAFRPELSNGALMDIGVYCVRPMVALFGMPEKILADGLLLPQSIDGAGAILAKYPHMQAQLVYSKINQNQLESQIQGEDASLLIDHIAKIETIRLVSRTGKEEVYHVEREENNMVYEIQEWMRLIAERDGMEQYLEQSRWEMELMDEARKQIGIVFPADKI